MSRTNNDGPSPLYYHVPGVSSPTPSEDEPNNNNNNNSNREEYQQDDDDNDSLFLNLEDIFQQQRLQNENGQHKKKQIRMTTTSNTSPSAAASARRSSTLRRITVPRGVSTPRPSFDHGGGGDVVPIIKTTLSPLLVAPGGRGSSGSGSSDNHSPPPPPPPHAGGARGGGVAVTTTTTTTTTTTPALPPPPATTNYIATTIPLIASSSTTATNTASFGSDDTAPPFVFADNDDDEEDDYHTSARGASIFRLTRRKGKHHHHHHHHPTRSNSSSEIVSHDFDGDARIIQRACTLQDSASASVGGGLDEKQGSSADDDDDDDDSGGSLVPNFDKQIHSVNNTSLIAKPTAFSPAVTTPTATPMDDETKRQEFDDTKEEEEEEEFDFVSGSFTGRVFRGRLFTVRLSPVQMGHVASSSSINTAGTATNVVTVESMRRCSPRQWSEVATEESRGSCNMASAATNPDSSHIIPFDTATATTTAAAATMIMDAEAGRAFMNLMCALALMAAVSTSLLNDRDIPSEDIVSVALAGINAFIALSIMQNASRYKNRIEGPVEGTAALLFLSGFAVLVTSILFNVSVFIGLQLLEDISFWVNTVANLGVLVTISHFTRLVFDLLNLWSALSKKASGWSEHQPRDFRTLRFLTFSLIILTLLLLGAAITALVALSWSAIVRGLGKITSIPFWIALGTAAVITTSFVLEHYVCYNTRCCPHPGLICELFREEIDEIFEDMSARAASTNNNLDNNDITQDQQQQHRQQCWERTAKEFLHQYRFDIIFSPSRLTVLVHYLQQSETIEPCNEI